jgi:hypothetical protein
MTNSLAALSIIFLTKSIVTAAIAASLLQFSSQLQNEQSLPIRVFALGKNTSSKVVHHKPNCMLKPNSSSLAWSMLIIRQAGTPQERSSTMLPL